MMLFSFTTSPVSARSCSDGARMSSENAVAEVPAHAALRKHHCDAVRMSRGDTVPVGAAAILLPGVENHPHRHSV
jgi:hypothetical protein